MNDRLSKGERQKNTKNDHTTEARWWGEVNVLYAPYLSCCIQ